MTVNNTAYSCALCSFSDSIHVSELTRTVGMDMLSEGKARHASGSQSPGAITRRAGLQALRKRFVSFREWVRRVVTQDLGVVTPQHQKIKRKRSASGGSKRQSGGVNADQASAVMLESDRVLRYALEALTTTCVIDSARTIRVGLSQCASNDELCAYLTTPVGCCVD